MKKAIGMILAIILGLGLLLYTASRSVDFIQQTLPVSQQILAYFAIFALDGGLIIWLLNYLFGARGGWQHAICILMVLVDFTGIAIFFTLDTLLNTGESGMTTALDQNTIRTGLLALSLIISANIGAVVAHHLTDPETRRKMAEEEAQGQIEDETVKLLSRNSKRLAVKLAPRLSDDWLTAIEKRNVSQLSVPVTEQPQALPVTTADIPVNPTRRRKAS